MKTIEAINRLRRIEEVERRYGVRPTDVTIMRDVKPYTRSELEAFTRLYFDPWGRHSSSPGILDIWCPETDDDLTRLFRTALAPGATWHS